MGKTSETEVCPAGDEDLRRETREFASFVAGRASACAVGIVESCAPDLAHSCQTRIDRGKQGRSRYQSAALSLTLFPDARTAGF
jgi:hypothetical protein